MLNELTITLRLLTCHSCTCLLKYEHAASCSAEPPRKDRQANLECKRHPKGQWVVGTEVPFGLVTHGCDSAAAANQYRVVHVILPHELSFQFRANVLDQCSFCFLLFQVIMYDQHRKSTSL